ncbi:MAG TPA: sodium:calcium antiporter, partial [Phycisphaerales bacterium]|nr:sodium:calcium antiporter [Phycisphaerales bacterium]
MSQLFLEILGLVAGLAILIVGADLLVRGAAQLARVLGLSPFAIGVTVVAFGTSAPELFASIGAALLDVEELAIGNVVGSNIANILLILGAGAIIAPIGIHRRVRLVELPIMLVITGLTVGLL